MVCRLAAACLFVLWAMPIDASERYGPPRPDGHAYTIKDREDFDPTDVFMDHMAIHPELLTRSAIYAKVEQDFRTRNFVMLEALIGRFRNDRPRSKSGVSNLGTFYIALARAIGNGYWLDEEARAALDDPSGKWQVLEGIFAEWQAQFPDSKAPQIGLMLAHQTRATESSKPYVEGDRLIPSMPADPQLAIDLVERLDANRDVLASEPHWYVIRIGIAGRADPTATDTLAIIEDGLRAHPGYYEIAFAALRHIRHSFTPDFEALESWISRAAEIAGPEHGEALYSRLYWYAFQLSANSRIFTEPGIDWERFKDSAASVLDAYPDPWNLNNFALFACLAGDTGETARLIVKINDAPLMQAWRSWIVYRACYDLAVNGVDPDTDEQPAPDTPSFADAERET